MARHSFEVFITLDSTTLIVVLLVTLDTVQGLRGPGGEGGALTLPTITVTRASFLGTQALTAVNLNLASLPQVTLGEQGGGVKGCH